MTQLLPGQLLYIFGASILDAALLSWLALLWYRRSVNRLMREARPDTAAASAEQENSSIPSRAAPPPTEAGELILTEERPETLPHTAEPIPRTIRLIVAYGAGAAAFAAVITGFKFWAASPPLAVVWLIEWWTNLWPVVPALVALLVLDRPIALRLTLLYVLGGAIAICLFTAAGQLLRGTLNTAPLTNIFWAVLSLAWTASLPFAVIVLTSWRRVRAVMPLALAATLLFGFGSMLFRDLFIRALSVEAFRSAFLSGAVLFSSHETLLYALFMLVSLPVGWLAWRLLNVLAAAFANKRFSDIQLVVDCWWAVAAAEVTATSLSTTYGVAGIAAGVAAFLAYRLAVAAVLRGDRSPQWAPRLLLLRVFGYQARTESLFDRVAQTWRLRGPVQLIAGVDLAMRTADPADVLALLDGRLAEAYVRTSHEVGERVDRLDLRPDPDGRYRINEVYCHDNTWRMTLEALLDRTDRVLMDLRSFSAQNAGCKFELEQLVRRVPTEDIVLVCDKTTDLPLLHQILAAAWTAERRDGRARGTGEISVVRVERQTRSEFALLMHRLLRRPQPAAVPV